jgi:GMP synthase-like glutamine amidotransferase
MRALAISHQRDAGPGVFAEAFERAGAELETWHVAEDADPPADPHRYDAVITLGGAMHADQEDRHPWLAREKRLLAELLERGTPLLGVCLGAQLLAEAAGGRAVPARRPEIGWFEVEVTGAGAADPLLAGLSPRFEAFEWHSYEVVLPDDAVVLARAPVCVQAYRIGERAWGIQFHAEVSAADARRWIAKYKVDPGAVAIGVDLEALDRETEPKIGAFNDLGRELCASWLAAVAVAERA